MGTSFTPETFRFLRGLARHNDRVWFEERRPTYERTLRTPLLALIEDVNAHLDDFAPAHIRPANKVARRIYRDTRFSPDKRPYKRHLEAWWARDGLQKTSAAGFFLQVAPAGGFLAAGVYDPDRDDLLLIRRWLAENAERFRTTLKIALTATAAPALHPLEPNALSRNPKGFPSDHPAGDLLRFRNWGLTADLTEAQLLDPGLSNLIATHFRAMTPLVDLLNEPFLDRASFTSTRLSSPF